MKINLRNAAKLVSEIDAVLANLTPKLNGSFVVDENDTKNIDLQWEKESAEYEKNITNILNLTELRFEIRHRIATAKSSNGIDELISTLAMCNTNLRHVNNILSNVNRNRNFDIEYVKNMIENNKKKSTDDYYNRSQPVQFSLLKYKNALEEIIIKYKKDIRKIDDKILSLNVKAEIDLTGQINGIEILDILKQLKIV